MPTPRIAIIGAGPAGLTLARILYQNGVTDVTIFEQEGSRHARTQGGSLDLHPRSGQAALKAAGLFDQFKKLARYDGQDKILVDSEQNILIDLKGLEYGRPEIDREQLRDLLLDSVPDGIIKWNQKIKTIEAGTITLSSGETVSGFDLIVGADGAWSKVRPLLTSVKPFYSGISGCELRFHKIAERHPEVSRMIGRGTYFALGDGRCFGVQRQGNGDVKMLAAAHQPEDWVERKGANIHDAEQMKKLLLEDYASFADGLRQLIEIAEDDIYFWPFYMLPVGLEWRHHAGATLIGDAAHLMTPFAGEGVNNAMADSLSLAKLILESKAGKCGLDEAVQRYEKEMFVRVTPSMQRTWQNLQDRFFHPDAPTRVMRRFKWILPLLKIWGWFQRGRST